MFKISEHLETDFRKFWKKTESKEIKQQIQHLLRQGFEQEFLQSLFAQEITRKEFYISDAQFRVLCNMAEGRGYRFPILDSLTKLSGSKKQFRLYKWKDLAAMFSMSKEEDKIFLSVPFNEKETKLHLKYISFDGDKVLLVRQDKTECYHNKKEFQGLYWVEYEEGSFDAL
jgi:hypothetical protein